MDGNEIHCIPAIEIHQKLRALWVHRARQHFPSASLDSVIQRFLTTARNYNITRLVQWENFLSPDTGLERRPSMPQRWKFLRLRSERIRRWCSGSLLYPSLCNRAIIHRRPMTIDKIFPALRVPIVFVTQADHSVGTDASSDMAGIHPFRVANDTHESAT